MITTLHGIIQQLDIDSLVLEVGGVGIQVEVPAPVIEAAPGIGKPFLLHTRLVVKDDSLEIYGFLNQEQRELFNLLTKISGVGPKLGLAILSNLSPEMLQGAVANDQPEVLASVPGIGAKTARKIAFHLKDRLEIPADLMLGPSEIDNEVLEALTTLGYSLMEAQAALKSLPKDAPEDVEMRVRLALKYFFK
jgi:Holliday junction DNA helicase RuvA